MATVTQTRLRELLARAVGFYFSGTATGGSTTTIADTSVDGFDAYDDNLTAGMWAYILAADAATPENETRKVTSVSTTTLTVDTAYGGAPASGDTYELLPYHTRDMNDAIRESIRSIPQSLLYLPLRDQTLTVDDRLTNGNLNTFSSTFTGWTHTVATWTQETTITFEGGSSAKGVASGANSQLTQAWQGSISEIAGQTAFARFHALARAGNVARVGIDFGNSIAISWSSYHSGNSSGTGIGQWEPLEVSVAVPAEAASITIILEVTDGSTAYFDWGGGLRVGEIDRYTLPTSFIGAPYRVMMMPNDYEPDGQYLPVTRLNRARGDRLLRLEGKGRLTVPTVETSTVEVDEAQAGLIVAKAAELLFIREFNMTGYAMFERLRGYWAEQYAQRAVTPGIRMATLPADPWPDWGGAGLTADSSGHYLTLVR